MNSLLSPFVLLFLLLAMPAHHITAVEVVAVGPVKTLPELSGLRLIRAYTVGDTVHIAGIQPASSEERFQVVMIRYAEGTWTDPEILGEFERASAYPVNWIELAADALGNVAFVWINQTRDQFLWFYRLADGTVTAVQSRPASFALRSDVVVAPDGQIHAIYRNKAPKDVVYHLTGSFSDTDWVATTEIPSDSAEGQRQPSLAVDGDGALFFAYRWMAGGAGERRIGYRSYDPEAMAWSAVEDTFLDRYKPWNPVVVVDDDDQMHILWLESFGTAAYRSPSGSIERLVIPTGVEHGWPAALTVLPSGTVLACVADSNDYQEEKRSSVRLGIRSDDSSGWNIRKLAPDSTAAMNWPALARSGDAAFVIWNAEGECVYQWFLELPSGTVAWDFSQLESGVKRGWINDWIGWIAVDWDDFPWVYVNGMGYTYPMSIDEGGINFYWPLPDEWMYSSPDLYPFFWSYGLGEWLMHFPDTSLFQSLTSGQIHSFSG